MLVTRSEPVITLEVREKLAKSYAVYQNYRPYPRYGRLSEAPAVIETQRGRLRGFDAATACRAAVWFAES